MCFRALLAPLPARWGSGGLKADYQSVKESATLLYFYPLSTKRVRISHHRSLPVTQVMKSSIDKHDVFWLPASVRFGCGLDEYGSLRLNARYRRRKRGRREKVQVDSLRGRI